MCSCFHGVPKLTDFNGHQDITPNTKIQNQHHQLFNQQKIKSYFLSLFLWKFIYDSCKRKSSYCLKQIYISTGQHQRPHTLCFLQSLVTAKTFGLHLLKNVIYTYSVFTYKQIRCSYVKKKSVAHHWPVSTVSVTFYYDVFADMLEYPESQCNFFYREPQMQSRICMYLCRYKSTSMYMIEGRRKLIILFACFVQIWNRTMKTCSPILVYELLAY